MNRTLLALGDVIALAIITLIGFASHGEFSAAYLGHMGASFVPLCVAWLLLAPSLGLFEPGNMRSASQLWRPAFVMLFAGPLAALMRSIALGDTVIPSFAIVLTLTSALALTAWRLIAWLMARQAPRGSEPQLP